uniref:(northern house mosquito) hypothetical protein n=1 Tax=Culex pipiens TaxID=7175 RepID=A0A8D8DS58_CULPI
MQTSIKKTSPCPAFSSSSSRTLLERRDASSFSSFTITAAATSMHPSRRNRTQHPKRRRGDKETEQAKKALAHYLFLGCCHCLFLNENFPPKNKKPSRNPKRNTRRPRIRNRRESRNRW